MSVLHPTEKEFDQLLKDNSVVLVDFWATWCGPCKMVAPIIEKVAAKYEGKVVVAKVDVDKNQALAQRYQIMSIPTVIVFKDGKAIKTEVGSRPQDVYEKMIDKAL